MPITLVAATVAHEIATLILVGSLFFILFVQLPAIASVRSPRARLRLRRASFQRLFGWGWLGLLLLWLTGAYDLIANLGLFHEATAAVEDRNSERASWLYRRLRVVVGIAFVLALAVMVLDVAGPAVVGFAGLDLKALLIRG